ncbi:MAG: hypothetical protein Q7S96_03515 [bacterium]|nr:hypothetical protein [bacterium]
MELTHAHLEDVPQASGVYTFLRSGMPIYIGKAADLRARLSAYKPGGGWKEEMVEAADELTIERTSSEVEALLLEAALIKQHQPKYNVLSRDDKQFLSVLVTTDEDFPQVLVTRSHRRSGTTFGPFTSARAVRETLKALRRVFPYRCKNKPPHFAKATRGKQADTPSSSPSRRGGEKTGRPCLYFHMGLCAGTCAGRISKMAYRRQVIAPLLRVLRGETKAVRKKLDIEHRALLDDVLAHANVLSTVDKYAIDVLELQRVLQLPLLPHRIEGYDISNLHGQEAVGSMVVAIDGEPDPSQYRKFKIRVLEGKSNDVGMLREVLSRRLARAPRHDAIAPPPAPPDAAAQRKSAGIPTSRRDPHDEGEGKSKDVWPLPDLMVIDGGKGQLNAVLRAMRDAGVTCPVVGLAKRNEEIYLPGERKPLVLPKYAPALHLLQRVRDEAHRFAIGYHRERYRKRMLRS